MPGDDAHTALLAGSAGSGTQPLSRASTGSGALGQHHEEQAYVARRLRDTPMWTLDRGTGVYQAERLKSRKASLLGSGKDASKSRVAYQGIEWGLIMRHVWKRDFFTTAVHARFQFVVLAMLATFISSFLFWACIYYAIWRLDAECFLGFNSFLSAFLFSIETQNTIGYGSHAIGDCWLPAWLVGIQCILAVLLEALFIGVVFAKISHPKGRSRTIIISECACIARRDGIVKFMFRVADMRKRTALAPRITAHLYTWGPGHTTAEGEHIPVLVQALPLHYHDPTLLLPVVCEHTIDERSPLYGHTTESLEGLQAEVVVTFEGHSELGDMFTSRQSYLPSEIHFGCVFAAVISQAPAGSMAHAVDLSRFHDVQPLPALAGLPATRASRAVVRGGSRRIPRARLGENTLLLADELCVTRTSDGRWFVAVRVGDAYPSQMASVTVRMFVYRYAGASSGSSSGHGSSNGRSSSNGQGGSSQQDGPAYTHQELALTANVCVDQALLPAAGAQEQQQQQQPQPAGLSSGCGVLLRYPVLVGHELSTASPLAHWLAPGGMLQDSDAEIVVVATATQYVSSHLAMRSKVYSVLGAIRWDATYAPCLVPPRRSPTGHACVDWAAFHTVRLHGQQPQRTRSQGLAALAERQAHSQAVPVPPVAAAAAAKPHAAHSLFGSEGGSSSAGGSPVARGASDLEEVAHSLGFAEAQDRGALQGRVLVRAGGSARGSPGGQPPSSSALPSPSRRATAELLAAAAAAADEASGLLPARRSGSSSSSPPRLGSFKAEQQQQRGGRRT